MRMTVNPGLDNKSCEAVLEREYTKTGPNCSAPCRIETGKMRLPKMLITIGCALRKLKRLSSNNIRLPPLSGQIHYRPVVTHGSVRLGSAPHGHQTPAIQKARAWW